MRCPGGTDPEHPTPYTVITRDPFCPSAELHARAGEPAEAVEPTLDQT